MGAIEAKMCVVCFNPIEAARIVVLGLATSICAKCAHARSTPPCDVRLGQVWDRQTGTFSLECGIKHKEKKERVDYRILRSVIWDGSPKQVSIPSAYVLEDICLEVLPDGEIWSRTIMIGPLSQ
jgi:hypothetical protein